MPELPEVEAVCRRLRTDAAGRQVIRMKIERPGIARPQEPAEIEEQITGRSLDSVERRGKNIFLHFSGSRSLHVHLRMTGNLYVIPDVRFRIATARAWFELEGGRGLIFEDPRALGRIRLCDPDETLAEIGVEPLSDAFTPDHLCRAAAHSRQPAKLFLMDQRHVAGLGNIYAAEALFRAGISPLKPMSNLRRQRVEGLHAAIVEVLREGLESAVLAYARPGVFHEGESFPCAVYDREGEPCRRCGRKIRRIAQGGRSTYYCPGCQR